MYEDLICFYQAFITLSSSRSIGFGIGSIPYSEIICYLNENDISSYNERQEYTYWIQKIDGIYLGIQHDKDKKKQKKHKAN